LLEALGKQRLAIVWFADAGDRSFESISFHLLESELNFDSREQLAASILPTCNGQLDDEIVDVGPSAAA